MEYIRNRKLYHYIAWFYTFNSTEHLLGLFPEFPGLMAPRRKYLPEIVIAREEIPVVCRKTSNPSRAMRTLLEIIIAREEILVFSEN